MKNDPILLKGVKVHNLKNVDLTLHPNQLIVITGVSGSGKSSLAFDTIYVEGQRRYIESLSTYARRYLGNIPKPEAEHISGISPTIAIEQKTVGHNPRSTVGTITGIYDYLRVLFARVGTNHCPVSGEVVTPQSLEDIVHTIKRFEEGSKLVFLAPYIKDKKGELKDQFAEILRKGFTRIRLDGNIVELSDEILVDKTLSHSIDLIVDRIVWKKGEESRIKEAVTSALELGEGLMTVLNVSTKEEKLFSRNAHSVKSGLSYSPLEPHDFSFNHPAGMCPTCEGLGVTMDFDLDQIIDPEKSIAEGCCSIAGSYETVKWGNIYDNLAKHYKFSVDKPWKKLDAKAQNLFLYGSKKKWLRMDFVHPTKKTRWHEYVKWRGVIHEAKQRLSEAKSDIYRKKMESLMSEGVCPTCNGSRIKPYPSATTLGDKKIHEITAMTSQEAVDFFENLSLTGLQAIIAKDLLIELQKRIRFLYEIGLYYLTLDRTSPTLSGGEAQRVRLASQIGSGLVGTTYILDEPSIGLHPRDQYKLLENLKRLRDRGNTIIIVEHDEETMYHADTIVDVGPFAGTEGGEILGVGDIHDLLNNPKSITGAYLSGRKSIAIPEKRRKPSEKELIIRKAAHHNLKEIDVAFPLEVMIAITGVSGSGKSSLISDILRPALANHLQRAQQKIGKHGSVEGMDFLDKSIAIDQSPIGRTPRSNPSTYIKLFDDIRELFAELPESKASGFKAGRFSFNVKEGSCPQCGGMGVTRVDMDFMEDEFVTCSLCSGKRFDPKTLSILYKGKSIYDILEMTIKEALIFFDAIPHIKHKLDVLTQVGLDYMTLGQSSTTLSGGEAQRIKLAKEIIRPAKGHTCYILDEPTTGLHFHDIHKLIDILQHLVDEGNTVIVIEHNMDLIKTADWIIDLGPEGGRDGGKLMFSGTPEECIRKKTPTGIELKKILKPQSRKLEKKERVFIEGETHITVKGARQNNLKELFLTIPRDQITICTGPSGSGKTSLAFDTIYAEGQRRYIDSLSTYARQFVKQMPKPQVGEITGLSPAIAIEQKHHAGNPRSTVGTMTEIYDFLRILYAHMGTAYCPETGEEIKAITKDYVVGHLMQLPEKTKLQILSPLKMSRAETFEDLKNRLIGQGFLRIRLNKAYYELDEEISYDPKRKNELHLVIDRLAIKPGIEKRLFDAIDQATTVSKEPFVVALDKEDMLFNLAFAVQSTGKTYPPLTPHSFSFNAQEGMCPDCQGLGFQYGANLLRYEEVMKLNSLKLAERLWKDYFGYDAEDLLFAFLESEEIDETTPLYKLPVKELNLLLNGSSKPFKFQGMTLTWKGLNPTFAQAAKAGKAALKQPLIPHLEESTCISCQGARIKPLSRHVLIDKTSIADLCAMPLDASLAFIQKLPREALLQETMQQLESRLSFLCEIGVEYLSLNRGAPTLSGGETQRIHLARQLGSGLTGCLYVLDEPTIGLHPENNARLNRALKKLKSLGNTLLMVEHDPLTLEMADYLFDFGPQSGNLGGEIMAEGTLKEIMKNPQSLTGAYLSKKKELPIPKKRRSSKKHIAIENANVHNLKNLSMKIPTGVFNCITGISGSGKSSLIYDILKPALQMHLATRSKEDTIEYAGAKIHGLSQFHKLISIDQNPIGTTNRADVSTYSEINAHLRAFYAQLPLAQARGLQPKYFSYNHLKGMCRSCWGLGFKSIRLQFLPALRVTCDACHGKRLNPVSLEVKYKGRSLGDLLTLTIEQALEFFPEIPKLQKLLETLMSVGLGYLTLGQEIASLSGGEAGRLRLARELAKNPRGKALYLFDEPTIGLHFDDLAKLLPIFHSLVEKGHTLILIEHNLDIIRNADHIIDLGPDAGMHGGELVASGTPEEVSQHPTSYTAKHMTLSK